MNTTTIRTLALAGLVAGATFAAYAATPRLHAPAPPTADQLGLAGADAAEWNTLRDQTIDLRDSARATALRDVDTLRVLLATETPDLDAFDREIEQAINRHAAASRALRQRKLAFYDRLAPAQQAKLRAAMLDRLNRLDHLRSALMNLDTP
jgi:Spy/CpxP family protein refolding chaperone